MTFDYNTLMAEWDIATPVGQALVLAHKAHKKQTRRDGKTPYIRHPIKVWLMARGLGMSDDAQAAALCHDVREDCDPAWHHELDLTLTTRANHLVRLLSKHWPTNTAPDLVLDHKKFYYAAISGDEEALILKLLDRTDNMRDAIPMVAVEPRWVAQYLLKSTVEFSDLLVVATALHSPQAIAATALFLSAHDKLAAECVP
jgi:(p)ppGpp synthase/HD superfamily hydrolase